MVSKASGDLLLESVHHLLEEIHFTHPMLKWLIFELAEMDETPVVEKLITSLKTFVAKRKSRFEL